MEAEEKKWKVCGDYFKKVHLKDKSADKTLCGRPQENYDTEEGQFTLETAKKDYGERVICKSCTAKAMQLNHNQ